MSSLDAFYAGGPKTWNEAFPPVCLTTHWDPTALTNHILPQPTQRNLALDPRPSSKICTEYYDISAGDAQSKQQIGETPLPIPTEIFYHQMHYHHDPNLLLQFHFNSYLVHIHNLLIHY